ncbi:glycosyltransferase [bacterium]|nr:glycosyltransferase [bacterium]
MKRKVLFITSEAPSRPGRSVTGGALRVKGLAAGLARHGHEVILSVPRELIDEGDTDAIVKAAHVPENLADTIFSIMPDVVLIEQWALATFLPPLEIPVVIDLHGPLALENAFKEGANFRTDAMTKIDALARADFVIVPGRAQKQYFLPWCLMAGADPKSPAIATVPLSIDGKAQKRPARTAPTIVFGGSTWPWIDPFPALEIAAREAGKVRGARIALWVGEPTLARDHPLYRINRGIWADYRERLAPFKAVELNALVARDALLAQYAGARAALDVYQSNPERDLAYSTRTVEYLWCGLPVITSANMELAGPVADFDAGWVVDPNDEAAIAGAVREALKDEAAARRKSANARRLAAGMFDPKRAAEPLANFVARPVRRARGKSLMHDFREYYQNLSSAHVAESRNEMRTLSLENERRLNAKDERYELLATDMRRRAAEFDEQLRQTVKSHQAEIADARKDVRQLQQQLERKQKEHDTHAQKIEREAAKRADKLSEEIKRLNLDKEETRKKNFEETRRLVLKHESETSALRTAGAAAAQEAEARFAREVERREEMKKEYEAEIRRVNREAAKLVETHDEHTRKIVEKHEQELARLREKQDEAQQEANARIAAESEKREAMKKEYEAEIRRVNREAAKLVETHDEETRMLVLKHESETSALRTAGAAAAQEAEARFAREAERREEMKKEYEAEIRRVNREAARLVETHDEHTRKIVEKHEQELAKLREKQDEAQQEAEARIAAEIEKREAAREKADEELRTLSREKQKLVDEHDRATRASNERYEQQLAQLRERHDRETESLQARLAAEIERREDTKKEYDAELRRVNAEARGKAEARDEETRRLAEKHEDELSRVRREAEDERKEIERRMSREIEKRETDARELTAEVKRVNLLKEEEVARRDRHIEKFQERFEEQEKDHRAKVRDMEDERRRVIAEREAEAARMKDKEEEILVLLRRTQDDSIEKDRASEALKTREGELMAEVESLQKELEAREEAVATLKGQLDGLNAEIKSKFIELDRVVSEKEAFVAAAKERFDALENKTTGQAQKIVDLDTELAGARAQLDRTSADLAATAHNYEIAASDLDKIRRHASNLEGELDRLRRHYALAERILLDLQEDEEFRGYLRRKHRIAKYTGRLPRLGVLWGVNLVTNAYMEWWQNRTGVQIFPGMKRIEDKGKNGDHRPMMK